jgi:hypothetical protein
VFNCAAEAVELLRLHIEADNDDVTVQAIIEARHTAQGVMLTATAPPYFPLP